MEKNVCLQINWFFEKVKEARKRKVEDLLEEIQLSDDTLLFVKLQDFLDTHTAKENQLAKKIFLQKINFPIEKEEDIDNIFLQEFLKFKEELLQRRHKNLANDVIIIMVLPK